MPDSNLNLVSAMPRTFFAFSVALVCLLILTGFRLWLYSVRLAELRDLALKERLKLFWVGFRLDSVIISRATLILFVLALFLPEWLLQGMKPVLLSYAAILFLFLFGAESAGLFFFRYYNFRPNYLILEHGADREVLKTIRRVYPVGRILLFSSLGAVAGVLFINQCCPLAESGSLASSPWLQDRLATLVCLLITGFATRGTFDHRPLNPSFAAMTKNRIANEIASCGIFSVLYEWVSRFKNDFDDLKSTIRPLPLDEALRRAQLFIPHPEALTHDSPNPLVRRVQTGKLARPLNVILVVMESFTGRLTGCLGGDPALSPELDRLARQGVLWERCYATGERTIQALEAAVSSFPPLPGAGVVKRPQAHHSFATLASLLKERNYTTLFLYGGQGIFDQMRAFFVANGFDHFIEQKDFVNPAFRGTWGVSDEDLFRRADLEFRKLATERKPFFATLLTVSLHSPWEYPGGRITPIPPNTTVPPGFELEELNNFLYADYAIGKFIRGARGAPYFENSLFVFVGDHGVHIRGYDLIPADEYIVPALFFAPAILKPKRIPAVTSQIDLAPTIMGILGGEYRSPFFGRDVFHGDGADASAILIYNKRWYGIVSDRNLLVLSETGETLNYERAGDNKTWRHAPLTAAQDERGINTVALLGLAENLLVTGRYTSVKIADES